MSNQISEYFEFYHTNYQEIERINAVREKITNHIWSQIKMAPDFITSVKLKSEYKNSWWYAYYYTSNETSVFFSILPKIKNTSSPSVTIAVKIAGDGLNQLDMIDQIKFTSEEQSLLKPRNQKDIQEGFYYYAVDELIHINKWNFEHLGQMIADRIEGSNLLSIHNKILAALSV